MVKGFYWNKPPLTAISHLLVNRNTESSALEDFLLELCEKSQHCALLIFWFLQSSLRYLSQEKASNSFKMCRDMLNKVQTIVFGTESFPGVAHKIHEHSFPALVLAGVLTAAIGMPSVSHTTGRIAISQARRTRKYLNDDSEIFGHTRARSLSDAPSRKSLKPTMFAPAASPYNTKNIHHGTYSQPSLSSTAKHQPPSPKPLNVASLNPAAQSRILQNHYYSSQIQFLQALQDISNRLLIVPKPARLGALRAELSLLDKLLPADVCIPILCNCRPGYLRHDRIVRIDPNEATTLSSAERVPYLLMIEVLDGDLDFNTPSVRNQRQLRRILHDKQSGYRLFDLSDELRFASHIEDLSLAEVDLQEGDRDGVNDAQSGDISLQFDAVLDQNFNQNLFNHEMRLNLRPKEMDSSRISIKSHSRPATPFPEVNGNAPVNDTLSISPLTTHMRTAAAMLAQLDAGGNKRPKAETAAIKAKIISEMQELEEKRMAAFRHHGLDQGADGGATLDDLQRKKLPTDDPSCKTLMLEFSDE